TGISTEIIGDIYLEIFIQRNRFRFNAVQAAIHRIKAVGNIRKQQRLAVLEQSMEGMRQHFVRTVTDKHLIGLYTVIPGHRLFQAVAIRVGVQTQIVVNLSLHRRNGFGRWAVRIFIGIQLHQPRHFRLFTRHIGHQIFNKRAPELAHFLIRYSAERAWAVKNSPRASTEAILPISEAPSAEHIINDERFWKSYTPSGDENRAVPEVGNTWFGPAQ